VRNDRRESTSRSPALRSPLEGGERRAPALIVQVRDVGVLVAVITAIDTLAKLLICG
jgi:hypothetical protein